MITDWKMTVTVIVEANHWLFLVYRVGTCSNVVSSLIEDTEEQRGEEQRNTVHELKEEAEFEIKITCCKTLRTKLNFWS